ncbi:MAG: SDR family oxidoreductase [Pseudomonadales bacterium]|nr:SDR family oxidoreductase [Pseudomonadales bacterium]
MSRGIALITGASSGIGEALAHQFAGQGFDLIITARRGDLLANLAETLEETVQVDIITCDLAAPEGAQTLFDAVTELGKPVDILVNNAGVAHSDEFHKLEPQQVSQLIALNITALTTLSHLFLNEMVARGSGRILNVASVAAFQPVPAMSLYAASKAFVLSLTEALSEELRGTGVSVTALCPGLTKTEMVEQLAAGDVPEVFMSSTTTVAREGYEALMAREVIRIPGLANQAAVTWAQHQPRWLVRGIGGFISKFRPPR